MANNDREPSTKKRGWPANKLTVKLFLLDPDHVVTKVTNETCSKSAIEILMQNGYGPPQPEYCTKDEEGYSTGKVEFSFELTNEAFKRKLVEIYPKLGNACFVFMKADKLNNLVELNPGECCFRCYTPENVNDCEQGQGRIYIKKIAESEISQCNHGVSVIKRLRSMASGNQPFYVPIAPTPVATLTQYPLATSSTTSTGLKSAFVAPPVDESTPTIQKCGDMVPQKTSLPPNSVSSGLSVVVQDASSAAPIVSLTETTPSFHSPGNMVPQSQSPLSAVVTQTPSTPAINMLPQIQSPLVVVVTQTPSIPTIYSSSCMVPQGQSAVTQTPPAQAIYSPGKILPQNQSSLVAVVSRAPSTPAINNIGNIVAQSQSPLSATMSQTPSTVSHNASSQVQGSLNMPPQNQLPMLSVSQRKELRVDEFFENVKLTSTLKISLKVLDSDALLKRLNESTINIHTVEIESTCKLHQVLNRYSLPSCLKVLRINDNTLNFKDISDLLISVSGVSSLYELDLCRTKFEECSFNSFLCVLRYLRGLSLTENDLTKRDITNLITALKLTRNLERLNLSKSNITEAQANDILHKLEQAKNLASLDLSQNALQGNEIIVGICQLQSLEEIDLSHNYIRFFPFPDFEGKHESLSTNTKNISLSFNHMIPDDISQFCSLIGSDLLKLNLDFNHVCNSIWSLCAIRSRIKHLNVLSLASTDICDASGVRGLAVLLSAVRELKELNLSSNNLTLKHFQQLESPLLNLLQLKRLNLSNNPDGISALLKNILPSLKNLEELRLSNTHLNGDGLKRICDSLASLKNLKYLELSMNSIGSGEIRELANILKEFPLLERLDLSRSCLHDDGISVLCQGLVRLKKLKYLNLSGSMIDSQILDDAWFLPPTLEELILGDVIHGEKLFAKLKPLQHLRILHLINLKLRTCDVEMLATTLSSFLTLEELSVDNIVISDSNCYKIFRAIKWLGYLRKIHLTNLKLRACDVEMLATTLSSFPTLEELSLANIVVENSNLDKLFSAIKSLKNIKKIDLSGIKLCDESGLADMLSSLLSLEELVLSGMSVANMDDVRFFSAIKLLKRLKKLDLGNINVREEKALFDMLSSLLMLEEIVFPAVVLENSDGTVGYFSALASLRYLKNLDLRWSKICESAEEALAPALLSLQLLRRLVLGVIDCDNAKQLFAALANLKYLKELDLGKTCISKTVAGSLACVLPSLKLLEKLVLKGIDYHEQMCAALVNLKYLKELDLYKTNFTKTGVEALGRVLPSLTLEKLVLAIDCRDKCDEELFAALGNLKILKELHLGESFISETAAEALVRVLPSLTLLEKLELGGIASDHECDEQLFSALGNLKYLKELHLVEMNITKPCTEALARVLPSLTLLEKLALGSGFPSYREFDDLIDSDYECDEQLFAAIGSLKYLEELHLSGMIITKPDAEALARVLPSLTLLERLVLGGIDPDDECDEQLFAALRNLKYLQELHLREISFTETRARVLHRVLPSMTLLEKLVFEEIDFDDECDEELFAELRNLKYLRKLRLKSTHISHPGAEALARALPSLTCLKVLQLIHVTLEDDKQLLHAVGELGYLEELHLFNINITKAGVAALADVLRSLGMLKKLLLCLICFKKRSDDQLFTAVGSLSLLNELDLRISTITQAGATTLTATLPRLRNLKYFNLPERIENDEDGTLKTNLKAAARFVPEVLFR